MTIGRIVATPLLIHRPELTRAERRELVAAALRMVGLAENFADRYPHREFSGDQRQRSASRALILRPGFLVADEPCVGAGRFGPGAGREPAARAARKLDLSILFIAHDATVIKPNFRTGRGDVSRHPGRDGADRGTVSFTAAPLHRGIAIGGSRTRSGPQAKPHRACRRPTERIEPTVRMPIPHTLPLRRGGARQRDPTVPRGLLDISRLPTGRAGVAGRVMPQQTGIGISVLVQPPRWHSTVPR